MSYVEKIRAGNVDPWVGEGCDGARRSAQVCSDELATLDAADPRRVEIEAQREAWLDLASRLEGVIR